MAADRDLLFGLLALQIGLVSQDQLLGAFRDWTQDRTGPLADRLAGRGALDPEDRAALDGLVERHLRKFGGDTERSLAALPAGRSTREALASLGDPELTASV